MPDTEGARRSSITREAVSGLDRRRDCPELACVDPHPIGRFAPLSLTGSLLFAPGLVLRACFGYTSGLPGSPEPDECSEGPSSRK